MKVFSVKGITKSGKTTTIENIIKELRKRRYSVGSVKEIHFEDFAIDTEGTNTYRHKEAGSQLVTARGYYETDILFQKKLDIYDILKLYDHDYVVLEGVTDANVPQIITAHNTDEIDERINGSVFAISGIIAKEINEYKGIPVINSVTDYSKLTDLIEKKVFDLLPDFPVECCNECGYGCRGLTENILKGKSTREDCKILNRNVNLYINDKKIEMVPFVEKILKNAVFGVVKELEGFKEGKSIKIEIGEE